MVEIDVALLSQINHLVLHLGVEIFFLRCGHLAALIRFNDRHLCAFVRPDDFFHIKLRISGRSRSLRHYNDA